ncbi:UvrD-helicase domain-containing protein [Candidatus Nitrotoga sp. M5]|uniref:UvrD-helicase domain-containing protein n=1 Tax=Candidatus Nitrotoga sp. M5 TaxID=2890409 RepID=UPI001EF7131B|nr:UvrD-helicase domain-containing protein [Candidatus Nitrotoga sp. M5]CAH1388221.1 DNA helicase [Candidatus Nitrotoga sp. M5]
MSANEKAADKMKHEMKNFIALNPQHSVVVEACAGSGKTWLLVSRILRLLLSGVRPGEILAITFTRKAAQEMQARLHEWLHFLATQDDTAVRAFLMERELHDVNDNLLTRARSLYRECLLAQPAITINTFHGWFMQIIQRAPLNADLLIGMQLLERTSALYEEAWQMFADSLRAAPDEVTAQEMQWLFAEYGLHNTRALLKNFVQKRAEWWAYTSGQDDAVGYAIEQLRIKLDVNPADDPLAVLQDKDFELIVESFSSLLQSGSAAQQKVARMLADTLLLQDVHARFKALSDGLYTKNDEPRKLKANKGQDEERYTSLCCAIFESLQSVRDALTEREALRMNQAALHCGAALLQHYQDLKLRQQLMDFTDVEWQVCCLLNQSDCAEYMQYKLDTRYKHVLLDEFQDTNPVQWQILQAWFAASAAVESRPTVFVVGDPKQSIYRFRRADARLFGEVRVWLQQEFGAHYLSQNITRRNAPKVLQAVNSVFDAQPDGFIDFETHIAHHTNLPGFVAALPLALVENSVEIDIFSRSRWLRNPLLEARIEQATGEREAEAQQFAAGIADIVARWSVHNADGTVRRAEYADIMVLVRKRTHLRVYESALRTCRIPFLTSRRGGLLDTLEAEDIQALLTFLITPFADLELAQVLRSPFFACSDSDLMQLAQEEIGGNWWSRLQRCVQNDAATAELSRAYRLLNNWLDRADKLPVHDLLDRIYFEGDLLHRYEAALPVEMHETIRANLQAFMEIALNVDAGRYPSLPRFLAELRELRLADNNESPDEGKVGEVGNAVRIFTVHEAKGLEAPIVWLLDANDTHRKPDSYSVLLDWPPNAPQPVHFSLFTDKRKRGAKRTAYFDAEEDYIRREEMNLLYVAMTRAKQALLVSGNGELKEASWYDRIATTVEEEDNPLLNAADNLVPVLPSVAVDIDVALLHPFPTGQRIVRSNAAQRQGTWLHTLLQHLSASSPDIPILLTADEFKKREITDKAALQLQHGISSDDMDSLWQQAQHLLTLPTLQRFFDPQCYCKAYNEMPYVNARGELRRIDRLVEFDDEVWVLDYKSGAISSSGIHIVQMQEYRVAMQTVYAEKIVRCALIFSDGTLSEIST